jgi:ATP-binding cassette subfamily E protein 1
MGQECIVWGEDSKPIISESLCIGCGICVHKCPFTAIKILNTPEAAEGEMVHRYGQNAFRLFRLPVPKPKGTVGLLGSNGIGKSTALRLLSGKERPNLGDYENPPEWEGILKHYRGTELQAHFRRLSAGELKTAFKPQYVDSLAGTEATIGEYVDGAGGDSGRALEDVGLSDVEGKKFSDASGGEMQLAAIARTLASDADLYFFDEPSSYLDIVNRLHVANVIRTMGERKSVVVVEHDLAILDYLADQVHLLYGESAAFGVVSHPMPTRGAINTYLGGYLRDENVRFRKEPIVFTSHPPRPTLSRIPLVTFETMEKEYPKFQLKVEGGALHKGETVGIVGPNATGKTTFVKLLAGVEKPTSGKAPAGVKVSYKPQYLKATGEANLKERVESMGTGEEFDLQFFQNELVESLSLAAIMEVPLSGLSGGELQRVAVAMALAREATLYLLDEPSAYLDVDERMNAAKVIRRAVEKRGATALIVDHDVYFLDLLADRMMVFHGKGTGVGEGPYPMRQGMNRLLKEVGVTFRRDEETLRPRVNKTGSVLDREQRAKGEYYYEPAS